MWMTSAEHSARLRGGQRELAGGTAAGAKPGLQSLIRYCLTAISMLAFGNLNSDLFHADVVSLQQALIAALWAAVSVLVVAGRREYTVNSRFLSAYSALIIYMMVVLVFKVQSIDSVGKISIMLVTVVGAALVAATTDVWEIMRYIRRGLFLVSLASVLVALFLPSVGLESTWRHSGQWRGVFDQKQLLGASATLLVLLSMFSVGLTRNQRISGVLVGMVCVIGSLSKNSMVLLSFALMFKMFVNVRGVRNSVTMVPLLCIGYACGVIVYFIASSTDVLYVFGITIDFTGRTYIWKFCLDAMGDYAFGDGLNVFWNAPENVTAFFSWYGWVLTNYHSGYVGVFVDTGMFGVAFMCAFTLIMTGIMRKIGRSPGGEGVFLIMILSYLYILNLTETFFLRSTSGYNSMFIMVCVFDWLRRPMPAGRLGAGLEAPAPMFAARWREKLRPDEARVLASP